MIFNRQLEVGASASPSPGPIFFHRLLASLLLLVTVSATRAELTLTNFSAGAPLKIMPMGDSITDDWKNNGAYRRLLQPMLETNNYPFIFTGRVASTNIPPFTKVFHEGYAGAVIAYPGVWGVHGYSTIDGYLQKITTDALAVVSNRPHLFLLKIGVNDVGHSRNPWFLATNDLPTLLNSLFSNTTNANIIVAKVTSLQDASLSVSGYRANATNIVIYNAAVQAMVNQRRALGQNVFIADMFSAVDYNTMFETDHIHPNEAGRAAMAREWLARIETITQRTNRFTTLLIHGGASWKYSDAGLDLGTNWAQPNFDDNAWSNGIARLGYGDPTVATAVSFGPNASNKHITTYFRRTFMVPPNRVVTNVNFRLARAHGAAVWLNGQELFRSNLLAGPLTYTNRAQTTMTTFPAQVFYPTTITVPSLPPGTNVVAVEIHQYAPTNSTLGFDLELIGSGYFLPEPSLSIAPAGSDIQLSWPLTNGGTFTLYATTNLAAGNWTPATSPTQTNGGLLTTTQALDADQKFFRLRWP